MNSRKLLMVMALVAGGVLGAILGSLPLPESTAQDKPATEAKPQPPRDFKGVVKLDVRDSTPDWGPFQTKTAPKGSPNVLFILYDDTGLAAWSTYGGRINMPTLDRLAKNGLVYTQWHNTALCSPTRSTLLTGRNHHLNGCSCITEGSQGYPGWSGRIPAQCATVGQVLQENGYSTFWLGKNHNVPEPDIAMGGTRSEWPLQKGFDRYYGFLGGETNQWFPDLVEDNKFTEQPYGPDKGYHISKDLADKAIEMLRDQKSANPSKPWYMWYCPGANHAPHHCPKEYVEKYKGKFDDGYESYRTWVLARMIEKGIMPKGTQLTPLNPLPQDVANPGDFVRPWDSLSADEKRLFSRMAEVYAGFSEYTDVQIGRIIDHLESTGQLDNTLIFYAADNGASGEGTPSGSVNENKFFNGYPDDITENLKSLDALGSVDTYGHYPTGWAAAFSTPFQMFKRYSHAGGTCCPMVIHWPSGIRAKGEIRNQYHHSTDVVPTILDACGLEMPKVYRGVEQWPLSGVSMRYSFDAPPNGPTKKKRQYYAMLGTRGMWEDGWKAVALHAPLTDKGHFDQDQWALYHVDADRSESKNLAKEFPDKVKSLVKTWFDEAERNLVLPLDDRTATQLLMIERPTEEAPRDRYVYYPNTAPVPEGVAANVRGRSFKILADVEIQNEKTAGVLFSMGTRFGGHALFIKDNRLHYVYNFLGIKPEQHFVSTNELTPGKWVLGMEFIRESTGPNHESVGKLKLYMNETVVAEGPLKTQPGKFGLGGSGLTVGYSNLDAVTEQYTAPAKFVHGKINQVEVAVDNVAYLNRELEMKRRMRD